MIELLNGSLAKSTKNSYKRAYVLLKQFYNNEGRELLFPIKSRDVAKFITFLDKKGMAKSTIVSYTSAIAYYHKIMEFHDPTSSFIVKKCLLGLKGKGKIKREPINLSNLEKLMKTSQKCFTKPESYAFKAICSLLFFGLFRISELLGDGRLNIRGLTTKDLKSKRKGMEIKLNSYKHSKGENALVKISKQNNKNICPIYNLEKYLDLRGNGEGNLFMGNDKPLSKVTFSKMLKTSSKAAGFKKTFSSHCFRIGAATYASKIGRTGPQIKQMGRWKSGAYNRYLKDYEPLKVE